MNDDNQRTLFDKDAIRKSTDAMTDKIDHQAIENVKTLQEKQNYYEELIASINRLENHSICPGSLPTCNNGVLRETKEVKQESKQADDEPIHGADCHCSKCCPNPNPNWLQKHRNGLLIAVIVLAMIVLGIGWTPTGGVFDAIQNSWVDLIVNVFKIAIYAIAGIAIYNLSKKKDEKK